jgi:serine protease Do
LWNLYAVFALMCVVGVAGAETVYLKNGNMVKGQVLAEKADRLIVDLGFDVVSVPTEMIDRVTDDAAGANGPGSSNANASSGNLWRSDKTRESLSVRQNVQRCGEAVVQVSTDTGLGSGFVIHEDGYIITNDHVIAGEHNLSVTLYETRGKEFKKVRFENVSIVATNPVADVALLKIEGAGKRKFKVAPLGDSDALRQGQDVFAIGSPLGLERSVSRGIVSLKNRELDGWLYIQTTTEINPGNSGGPLFNLRGEVVGITNMGLVGMGIDGLNFAIPVNVLKHFLANRDAFAFDPRNPNAGFRYTIPPSVDDAEPDTKN